MQKDNRIPFTQPYFSELEQEYVKQSLQSGQVCGDRAFSKKCEALMQERFGAKKVLLTHSCTAALEMAAMLCGIKPGDEVIMPSYTFVSTANAFALRGAKIVFADIREDTLNLDENLIERAITQRTKAIVPVHYASIGCEMTAINQIAERHGLRVVEDAAQAVDACYKDRYLGTLGDMGAYSFHETKNFVSGEGGALVINDDALTERAEILREKGTNRNQFFRGEVDKYTWVDVGSSYVPSDIIAAVLLAQLERIDEINLARARVAASYREKLAPLEEYGIAKLPVVPAHCHSNNHMFSLVFASAAMRDQTIAHLKQQQIYAPFHYVPLHSAPYAQQQGGSSFDLPVTDRIASSLMRLPMYPQLTEDEIARVCDEVLAVVMKSTHCAVS